MSGNAALAAAKRRRNPIEPPKPEQKNTKTQNADLTNVMSDVKTNREKGKATHPLQVILEHDKQLFEIERRLESLNMDVLNENTVELTNELDTLVRSNTSELRLLKTTVQKQQKSIQELTSVITSLRATISNHESTITELCQQSDSQIETADVATETDEVENDSPVELSVSEQ